MLDTVLLFLKLVNMAANNDCDIFINSEIGPRFENGQINLPDTKYVEGCNFDPFVYFLMGDEISALRIWLMRHFR